MSITSLFALGTLCTLFMGSLFNPIMGIMAYLCVYFLFNPIAWWCQPIMEIIYRPSFIAMIFLTLGCVIHYNKLHWRISKKEMAIYLFGATAWIVTHYSGVLIDHDTIKYLSKLIKTFVFLFLFFRVVYTQERINTVIWTIILCGVFLAYQGHVSGGISTGRLEGVGGNDFSEANALGAFLMSCVALLGFKLFQAPIWKKGLFALGIALMTNAFILTQSRSVFLGLVFATPLPFLKLTKRHKKQLWLYVFCAFLMFSVLVNKSFLDRMGTVDDTVTRIGETNDLFKKETLDRLDFWAASVSMFKDHPMGVGVSNFANIVSEYDPRIIGWDPHNTYVLCYTEIGIIGIIVFLFIIMESFLDLRRVEKFYKLQTVMNDYHLTAISLGTIYIIYVMGSMVTHSMLYTEIIWIYFALSSCLLTTIKNREQFPTVYKSMSLT